MLQALENSWNADTAQDAVPSRGKSSGQCAVSSMVIQSYFGGDIMRGITNTGIVHYWNKLPGGMWLDTTRSQFGDDEYLVEVEVASAEQYIFKDTLEKYKLLKSKVKEYGVDNG